MNQYMVLVEIATGSGTLRVGTHNYITPPDASKPHEYYEPRLVGSVTFARSVGLAFHGQQPRGEQNLGVIEINNADGALDTYVGTSLRDKAVTVLTGDVSDLYGSLTVVATLTVDRVEFVDTERVRVYTKTIAAKLDRALQQNNYPLTATQVALRGRPRPLTVGRAYCVPCVQSMPFGNGQFDVHEDDNWIGLEQVLDQGATLIEGTSYERCTRTGVFGFERLTDIGGRHVATVLGAFNIATTWLDDAFTSLAGWTETNGGVGGRDASIVSNALSLVNTLGGADLILDSTTTVTGASRSKYYFYQVDCTAWVSGSCQIRSSSVLAVVEKTIDAVGRYTGVIRVNANFALRIVAPSGSNCSLTLDNLKLYEVTPIESLPEFITYACVTKGPLASGDLDTASSAAIEAATGYRYGFHASTPVTCADLLDQLMASCGGAWWVNLLGKLEVGQLLAPTGTATQSFDQSNIMRGMRVEFDEARGMSTRYLARRNWAPYNEGETVAALGAFKLNSADKDADVTLSNSGYTYSAANVGSVRDTPALFGGRIYFEVTANTVDGTQQHYIGWGNASATITSYPGATNDSLAYRANGQSYVNAVGSAYGNTWAANDVIGVAVDMRPAAMGSRQQHFRVYWAKNGTWQNSGNPDTETAMVTAAINATALAYAMLGGNVAGTNAGTVNLGGATFAYTPPADYMAPAWHRQAIVQAYQVSFTSAVSLHASYAANVGAVGTGEEESGIGTLFSRSADATTEANRVATLYASERFMYQFTVLVDSAAAAISLEPFDLIEVTYSRFGLSAKKLRVLSVEGDLLSNAVRIVAWG